MGGTLKGTSLLFFGFIGFDEVCCLASRSENPAQVMPRAIAGTLFGATVLSVLAQLALGGMVDSDDDGTTSFEQEFGESGWAWAKWITSVGEGIYRYTWMIAFVYITHNLYMCPYFFFFSFLKIWEYAFIVVLISKF
jgi:amino acid transporter